MSPHPAAPFLTATGRGYPAEGTEGGAGLVVGIVLAGSHYWGDGPFERALRGPLLPVAQLPLIAYPLAWLAGGGITAATICAGTATRTVAAALGDGTGERVALRYYEDPQPRGPAGCARDAMQDTDAQTFVLVEGGLIPSVDLHALLAAHHRAGAAATTVVELDRRRGALGRAMGGTPPALPGGIYVFEREVLERVPALGFQDIKQGLLERLYAAGVRVHVHEVAGVSPRILDLPTYTAVSAWLIGAARERQLLPEYEPLGESLVHPTAHVHPTARLIGPVLVGPRATIGRDAVLVGPSSLGAGTTVDAGALVARSVLWERCAVGEHAVVDASVLADDVRVPTGARRLTTVQTAGAEPVDAAALPRPALGTPAPAGLGARPADELAFAPPSLRPAL